MLDPPGTHPNHRTSGGPGAQTGRFVWFCPSSRGSTLEDVLLFMMCPHHWCGRRKPHPLGTRGLHSLTMPLTTLHSATLRKNTCTNYHALPAPAVSGVSASSPAVFSHGQRRPVDLEKRCHWWAFTRPPYSTFRPTHGPSDQPKPIDGRHDRRVRFGCGGDLVVPNLRFGTTGAFWHRLITVSNTTDSEVRYDWIPRGGTSRG